MTQNISQDKNEAKKREREIKDTQTEKEIWSKQDCEVNRIRRGAERDVLFPFHLNRWQCGRIKEQEAQRQSCAFHVQSNYVESGQEAASSS